MKRRDFLRSAATASIGAAGMIVIPSTSAQSILETGSATLTEDDIKTEGKIITSADLVDEIVDMSQLGDNLAEILIRSQGPITFFPEHDRVDQTKMFWRVAGYTSEGMKFKQHGTYQLARSGDRNMLSIPGTRDSGRRN